MGIDLQGARDVAFSVLELILLEGGNALADERLGRMRIHAQGFVEGRLCVWAVVLFEQEHPCLVFRRPEVSLVLEGVTVNIGKNELKLVGEVVPLGVLAAGHTNEEQFFGVFDVLFGVVTRRVGADKPAKFRFGLLKLAPSLQDRGPDPARKKCSGWRASAWEIACSASSHRPRR